MSSIPQWAVDWFNALGTPPAFDAVPVRLAGGAARWARVILATDLGAPVSQATPDAFVTAYAENPAVSSSSAVSANIPDGASVSHAENPVATGGYTPVAVSDGYVIAYGEIPSLPGQTVSYVPDDYVTALGEIPAIALSSSREISDASVTISAENPVVSIAGVDVSASIADAYVTVSAEDPSVSAGANFANTGFESSLGTSQAIGNWYATTTTTGGGASPTAERLSSGTMTGSYVGRVYASGSYDVVYGCDGSGSTEYDGSDYDACMGDGGQWIQKGTTANNSSAYLVQNMSGSQLNGSSSFSMDLRPVTNTISGSDKGRACLTVIARDGSNNIINSTTSGINKLLIFGVMAASDSSADTSTISLGATPTLNNTTTKSFDLKTWLSTKMSSGKSVSDIVTLEIWFTAASGSTTGQTILELYVDQVTIS